MIKKTAVGLGAALLLITGSVVFAPSALATPPNTQVVYDSTETPLPGNDVSEAFEATSAAEIGNLVAFAPGTSRSISQVNVTLSSWACQTGGGATCVTTPGSTFATPITLNIYNVGAGNAVGSLITTVTQTFNVPFRPSADPVQCASRPIAWYSAADNRCYAGLANNISFNLGGVTLPDSVIYGVALNTSHHGYHPLGETTSCYATGCGYDSLNIGLTEANGPSVGSDPLPGTLYQNTTFAGFYCDGGAAGDSVFRLDSNPPCWGSDPSNVGDYSSAPYYIPAVQFVANQLSQTIGFTSTAPSNAYLGGPTYTVAATATSGLPVTYASTTASVCAVSGSTVSFVGTGTCTVSASQAGNSLYTAAPTVTQSFTVAGKPQSITFTSSVPTGAYVGGPTYTVSATATSGLPVIFGAASFGVCSGSGSTVSFTAAGVCNIVGFQFGNSTWASATPVVQTFTVLPQVAPSFTGPSTGTAKWLHPFSTTISAAGRPTPTVTVVSGLPLGVSATSNPNGSVTLSGTPLLPGIYKVTVKATNSAGSTTSTYTLTVTLL
jgi:hypothetical protein